MESTLLQKSGQGLVASSETKQSVLSTHVESVALKVLSTIEKQSLEKYVGKVIEK